MICVIIKGHELVWYLIINEVQSEKAAAFAIISNTDIPRVIAVFPKYLQIAPKLL